MTMTTYVIIGIVIMIITYLRDKSLLRVEWSKVSQWVAFLFAFTVFRIALISYQAEQYPEIWRELYGNLRMERPMWRLAMVFWEDAFFGMSIYYAFKYLKKWLAVIIAVGLSIHFGIAHGYQGDWAIVITTFYPCFLSYRYGKKNGFGTVMLCHIFYDFATVYFIKYAFYLI